MSNADLINERNRLQSVLHQLEAENRQYEAEVNHTVSGLHSIYNGLTEYKTNVNNTLLRAKSQLDSSEQTAENAYGLQQQIEALYPLYKNMEEADKRIRELNNVKYYEFKNFRMVRKIMQGLMDNLDFNLINDELIYKAVEKEHLQAPNFWLTCALLSFMGWKNDNRDHAERAIAEAYRISPKDSCVFYMIINLRLGREEAALKWLSLFEQQDLKNSDHEVFLMMFSLISKTVYENVSTDVRLRVEGFVNRVINECITKEGYDAETIFQKVSGHLRESCNSTAHAYPALQQYAKEYSQFSELLCYAENNANILERIRQIINGRVEDRNAFLKQYVDKLLEKPNQVEKDTYDEIEYNEMIIMYKGDKAAATLAYNEKKQKEEEEINIVSEMINWIHAPEKDGVNPQMRRNMFVLMKDFEQNGYTRYREKYQAMYRYRFNIQVGGYSSEADLTNPSAETQKVGNYFRGVLAENLSKISDVMAYILFVIAGVALIGGIIIGGAFIGIGVFAMVVAAIGAVVKLFANRTQRANLTKDCERSISNVSAIIHKLAEEFRKANTEYLQMDAIAEDIYDEFTKI